MIACHRLEGYFDRPAVIRGFVRHEVCSGWRLACFVWNDTGSAGGLVLQTLRDPSDGNRPQDGRKNLERQLAT
jgi:hypothetical protein